MRFCSHFIHRIPSSCVLCGETNPSLLCDECQKNLPILSQCCPQCARFLPSDALNLRCGQCVSSSPPFDCTYALFPYQPPLIQLIIQLKFQHHLSHAKVLGQLLIQAVNEKWYRNKPLPDLLLPVPLHPKRLRERGFNQALEMLRPVAKALSLPIDTQGVRRIKATQAQSGLSAKMRKQNIARAFAVQRDYSGRHIAVVDDVITTGHTVTALCHALKQQGAKHIDVWCAARRDCPSSQDTIN